LCGDFLEYKTMKRDMNEQNLVTATKQANRSEVEFDQWAKAVREQMVAALKRRGNG